MDQPTLDDLFFTAARKMVDGQRRVAESYTRLAKAADDPTLADRIEAQIENAKTQAERLDNVLAEGTGRETALDNLGVEALIREADAVVEAYPSGAIRDAALLAIVQHIEHYKIACYGTLSSYATALSNDRYAQALSTTLKESKSVDDQLNDIAEDINRQAAR